jgi:hypothetical protein
MSFSVKLRITGRNTHPTARIRQRIQSRKRRYMAPTPMTPTAANCVHRDLTYGCYGRDVKYARHKLSSQWECHRCLRSCRAVVSDSVPKGRGKSCSIGFSFNHPEIPASEELSRFRVSKRRQLHILPLSEEGEFSSWRILYCAPSSSAPIQV